MHTLKATLAHVRHRSPRSAASVSCAKLVTAFTGAGGRTVYALFESTLPIANRYAAPQWQCIALGEFADVLRAVFVRASMAFTGTLLHRSGRVSPEAYLRAWLGKMSQPFQLLDRKIQISATDRPFANVPRFEKQKFVDRLAQIGRPDLASELLRLERLNLQLHRDSDVLCALYGFGRSLAHASTVLTYEGRESLGAPTPALRPVRPRRTTKDVPSFEVSRVDDRDLVWQINDGPMEYVGFRNKAMDRCLMEHAYPAELAHSGGALRVLAAFTPALDDPRQLPLVTQVVLKLPAQIDGTPERQLFQAAREGLGRAADATEILTDLQELRDRQLFDVILSIPTQYWTIALPPGPPMHSLEECVVDIQRPPESTVPSGLHRTSLGTLLQ